mgnify:FL=1
MFPPEPEKPWWYHLIWALPCMTATGMLGYWLKSPATLEIEKVVKVPQIVYRTNTVNVPTTTTPPVKAGSQISGLQSTNNFTATRGVPVRTNRTAAAAIGLTELDGAHRDAPGFNIASGDFTPRPPQTDFEIQVALDRAGYSPGSIDGFTGPQTQAALIAFQHNNGLKVTGIADMPTKQKLRLQQAALVTRTITESELAQVKPLGNSWTEKSQQESMAFESVLEMLAEQHHCSPRYLMRINPTIVWSSVRANTPVKVPNTAMPGPAIRAALIHIQLAQRLLDVYDADNKLVARFPCSIATKADKRPVGDLTITAIAEQANYTFNPANFPTSPEARAASGKLTIPPGPNNPVGTTWLSLSKDSYGIHGTPDPEKVGRTTSLGCFRLANWNAQKLGGMVEVGTPVRVDP